MPWKVEEWEEGEVMGEGGGAEEEEVAEEEGEQAIEVSTTYLLMTYPSLIDLMFPTLFEFYTCLKFLPKECAYLRTTCDHCPYLITEWTLTSLTIDQRKREGAPSPEPIPNNNMPSGSCQQTQSEGAGNWARYANPEATGMSTFGDVKKARIDQQLFVRAGDRSREQRAVEDFLPANAPKDSQHNTIAIEVLAKPEETSRAIYDMGKCKRLRRESAPPDRKKCQPAPSSDRSLEDLFRENPAKSLQTSLNANTLNTAREVVIQVVNEATQQWFDNWYPDTKLIEIFDSILVQRHEEKVLGKDYVVPPEAFDLGYMRTTIADTYRKCHDVHPNGAGDSKYQ